MPTYEYKCKSCGHSFEAFQSMSDASLTDCPLCGKEVRRVINGGSGVIFKGSGFYVTDKKGGTGGGSKSPAKTDKTESAAPTKTDAPAPACAGCAAAESPSCPKAAG
jgi:putative FmdB family regulatory protein